VHDSIAFNQKEFSVRPFIAVDICGETGPLLIVTGYLVGNSFVLQGKTNDEPSAKYGRKKFISFNLVRIQIRYMRTSS
jgi:hypothetical protein